MRLGITTRRCYANSLGGTHPRHCGRLCDMASVSSVALRRPLPYGQRVAPSKGGPATPSNPSLVTLQGQSVTSGRQGAIPATVGPVWPLPCLQHHAGHCYKNSSAVGHAGTGRRHACHCNLYGSPSTASSSPSEDAAANHYTFSLEAAPVQVRNASR
jgi:hypothetical protein